MPKCYNCKLPSRTFTLKSLCELQLNSFREQSKSKQTSMFFHIIIMSWYHVTAILSSEAKADRKNDMINRNHNILGTSLAFRCEVSNIAVIKRLCKFRCGNVLNTQSLLNSHGLQYSAHRSSKQEIKAKI